jgi:putative pyruvate formate lyase activating enzyme
MPALAPIAHIGLHFGEEPPISGTRGSGTVFFAGCNLLCIFCQNFQISQEFDLAATHNYSSQELASAMLGLEEQGAHNINFVSPSHMIFQMADAILEARQRGLSVPIVYNSNGYDSVAALRQIKGLVDIYLPDIKYSDNSISKSFSGCADYSARIFRVLDEMLGQVGHLELDADGIARKGLLVRHLVLPGQLENSRGCLEMLRKLSKNTFVSIMSQYSPQYKACGHPLLGRRLRKDEYGAVTEFALELGLENVFVQELDSPDHYLPDFDQNHPFE